AGARRVLGSPVPAERFAAAWQAVAEGWSFDEVNDMTGGHTRWYPVESRLPMDPRRGDFVLVNGRDYRLRPLDAEWILARYPTGLGDGSAAARRRPQAVRSRVAPRDATTSVRAQSAAHARYGTGSPSAWA